MPRMLGRDGWMGGWMPPGKVHSCLIEGDGARDGACNQMKCQKCEAKLHKPLDQVECSKWMGDHRRGRRRTGGLCGKCEIFFLPSSDD